MSESRRGRLLVAAPSLVDPNFHRCVVLMLEHSAEGALGLVLNRPTALVVKDALPDVIIGDVLADDALVHQGGPVEPQAIIILGDFTQPELAASLAFDTVGVVDPDAPDQGAGLRAVRVFGGYAGWSAGQLEGEIAEEAWIDAPCRTDDVFCADPELLWSRVLDRKGGSYRLVARMPDDPSLN